MGNINGKGIVKGKVQVVGGSSKDPNRPFEPRNKLIVDEAANSSALESFKTPQAIESNHNSVRNLKLNKN